jgi:hypothetical protein
MKTFINFKFIVTYCTYPVPREWPQTKMGAELFTVFMSHSSTNLLSLITPISERSTLSLSP